MVRHVETDEAKLRTGAGGGCVPAAVSRVAWPRDLRLALHLLRGPAGEGALLGPALPLLTLASYFSVSALLSGFCVTQRGPLPPGLHFILKSTIQLGMASISFCLAVEVCGPKNLEDHFFNLGKKTSVLQKKDRQAGEHRAPNILAYFSHSLLVFLGECSSPKRIASGPPQ